MDISNIIIGLALIALGSFFIYRVYNYPNKTLKYLNFKGYIAGFSFIALGILIILGKGIKK